MNRRNFRRALIAALAICLTAVSVWGLLKSPYDTIENVEGTTDDSIRVLFVGNSHTSAYRIPRMVAKMAPGKSPPIRFDTALAPWKTLAWHQERGTLSDVLENRYDVIVLQTLSSEVLANPESVRVAVASASKYADRVYFVQPWPHAKDQRVETDLSNIAETAIEGTLAIGESLVRASSRGLSVFDDDGVHASQLGSYLVALQLCAAIYDAQDSECALAWSGGLSPDLTARLLKR